MPVRMASSPALQFSMSGRMETLRHYLNLPPVCGPSLEPTPRQPDEDVIFIALDLEAWEFDHRIITEVGIATLDTRDLTSADPSDPNSFLRHVKASHFIIKNHEKHVNRKFVRGCPRMFHFGTSKKVLLHQMVDHLDAAFIVKDERLQLQEDAGVGPDGSAVSKTARKMVLVGHDLKGDIKYLNDLNFSPTAARTVVAQLDTQKIANEMFLPSALGKLLEALEIHAENFHNAGNDAMFTMQALVLMALYGREVPMPPVTLATMDATQKRLTEIAAQIAERKRLAEDAKLAADLEKKVTIEGPEEGEDGGMQTDTFFGLDSILPTASSASEPPKPRMAMRIIRVETRTVDKDNDLPMDDAAAPALPAKRVSRPGKNTPDDNNLSMHDSTAAPSSQPSSLIGSDQYASGKRAPPAPRIRKYYDSRDPRSVSKLRWRRQAGVGNGPLGQGRAYSGGRGLRSGGWGRRKRLADEPAGWEEFPEGPLDYD